MAVHSMPDFVFGLAVSVGEDRSIYQVSAAEAVAPAHTGAASAFFVRFLSHHSALGESGLADFVPKASVFLVAYDRLVHKFLLYLRIDGEVVPGGVEDLFKVRQLSVVSYDQGYSV